MLIVEDGSACSEEIDFVELRCATVPAYAGMTRNGVASPLLLRMGDILDL